MSASVTADVRLWFRQAAFLLIFPDRRSLPGVETGSAFTSPSNYYVLRFFLLLKKESLPPAPFCCLQIAQRLVIKKETGAGLGYAKHETCQGRRDVVGAATGDAAGARYCPAASPGDETVNGTNPCRAFPDMLSLIPFGLIVYCGQSASPRLWRDRLPSRATPRAPPLPDRLLQRHPPPPRRLRLWRFD